MVYVPPTASPHKNLATKYIHLFGANVSVRYPYRKGKLIISKVFFLPITFANIPKRKGPNVAPAGKRDTIHVASAMVIFRSSSSEFNSFIISEVGHDMDKPDIKSSKLAEIIKNVVLNN